jgi:hypothetical protein
MRAMYTNDTTVNQIARDLYINTKFVENSQPFQQFLALNSLLPTTPNGPFYNALVKYARKNNIKLTFERPGWAKEQLIKVDLTNYTIKPIDRFSKLDIEFIEGMDQQKAPSIQEQKKQIGNNITYNLLAQLSENLNIPFRLITAEEARKMTENTKNPWSGEKAFYHAGSTFFIEDEFNADDVLHEFAHPLIDAVYATNKKLFDTLYNSLQSSAEGQSIIAEVTAAYPEFQTSDVNFQKEVLVRGLAKQAANQQKDVKSTDNFLDFIKRMFFALKQSLRKVFGTKVKVEKLSSKTTLSELANMLKSDKFDINTELTTPGEFVQYNRNNIFNPTPELTKELDAVEDSELSGVIDRFYQLVRTQLGQLSGANYKDVRKILTNDQTKKGLLQEIKSTLEVTPQINEKINELLAEADRREKNAKNLVHALMRFDILTKKVLDHLTNLENAGDSQEVMKSLFYYDLLVRNWGKFTAEISEQLFNAGLNEDSQLGKVISSVNTKIDRIQKRIQAAYTPGVVDTLKVSLKPLIEGIDDHFESQIKKIKDKGLDATEAGKKLLRDIEKEWNEVKLTDKRILDLLLGNAGDTNPVSAYLEAYTNSPDPIIGGFAMFIKNNE